MKKKIFIYPRSGSSNPYIAHLTTSLEKFYECIDYAIGEINWPSFLSLLRASFKSDCFVLNWLENVAFGRFSILQTLVVLLSLNIAKARKIKIIWIFHNIIPHYGVNWKSTLITNYLLRHSSVIIAHSEHAKLVAQSKARCNVEFIHHPVAPIKHTPIKIDQDLDLFYWGDIYDYKGIDILVEKLNINRKNIRLHILGRCMNDEIRERLLRNVSEKITFEERFADYDSIAGYINKSRYVIFPYTGKCVSSSGALIDTIFLSGNVLAPNIGAFKDFGKRGLCFTYNNDLELFDYIDNPKNIKKDTLNEFVRNNSWDSFAKKIHTLINACYECSDSN